MRAIAVQYMAKRANSRSDTELTRSVVVKALSDADLIVRETATNALWLIAPEELNKATGQQSASF